MSLLSTRPAVTLPAIEITPWHVPNYAAWLQRHTCVSSLSKAIAQWCPARTRTHATCSVNCKSVALPIAPPRHLLHHAANINTVRLLAALAIFCTQLSREIVLCYWAFINGSVDDQHCRSLFGGVLSYYQCHHTHAVYTTLSIKQILA